MKMNMLRKVLPLIFFSLFTLNLLAQDQSAENKIETLPREKSDALNNKWEVVPSLKVVPVGKFKGNQNDIHHQTQDSVYVKKTRDSKKPLLLLENENESHLVYNPNRKSSGLISGVLLVNISKLSDVDGLIKDYPITKIKVMNSQGLVIVKTKVGNDIAKVFKDLKNDSRVKNIEIEVNSTVKMVPN